MLSVYRKGTRRYFLARIIEKHDNVTSSKFAICYSNNADNTKAKCTIKMINEAFGDLQKAQENGSHLKMSTTVTVNSGILNWTNPENQ